MQLYVNPSDEAPIYRQIMRQVLDALASGQVVAGQKMASHRDLAAQLVIAPLTVKKAYDELERAGYLCTRRGRGTFVSDASPGLARGELRDGLRAATRELWSRARFAGLSDDELRALLEEIRQEMTS